MRGGRGRRWVLLAAEQGRFDKCHLRILLESEEALGGNPRLREEIDRRVHEAGIRLGALIVVHGWKTSGAAH